MFLSITLMAAAVLLLFVLPSKYTGSLGLMLRGKLRRTVNSKIDIETASRERIRELNVNLNNVRSDRNKLVGNIITEESELKELTAKLEKAKEAAKSHQQNGNIESANKAVDIYNNINETIETTSFNIARMKGHVTSYDNKIASIEKSIAKLETDLRMAAVLQKHAKTANMVEDLHDELHGGAGGLSDVVDQANESAAYAEAREQARTSEEKILNPGAKKATLEDLLK